MTRLLLVLVAVVLAAVGCRPVGTFTATCYSLRGTTASGLQAGPGRVAVDPRVIPLGTKLWIGDYGHAVAADVGPAVRGKHVDLWQESAAECREFGRREVNVVVLP